MPFGMKWDAIVDFQAIERNDTSPVFQIQTELFQQLYVLMSMTAGDFGKTLSMVPENCASNSVPNLVHKAAGCDEEVGWQMHENLV